MEKSVKSFLLRMKEKADFNQYWYSEATIIFLAQQSSSSLKCCFLSTPSIYFAFPNANQEHQRFLFEYDENFGKKQQHHFVKFDFNHPELIPEIYHNYFDFVMVDPPFITHEVWEKYATAIDKIIHRDEEGKIVGKILASTIDENDKFLKERLGLKIQKWKPSIPHLVYQYSLFCNYEDKALEQINPEIGE